MTETRLREILNRCSRLKVLVVGDLFLDRYWIVDPRLAEMSLETGLEAHQVVECRHSPGAAGTVASNLAALGLARIALLTVIGDDGGGYDVTCGLEARGIDSALLIRSPERHTPIYTKPIRREAEGSEREMERFDIKNRTPLPLQLEGDLLQILREAVARFDAVFVSDQVEEADCGVVGGRVREALAELARRHPAVPFLADSRAHIGLFRGVFIKPNVREASAALGREGLAVEEWMEGLFEISGRPVFLTRAADGISVYDGREVRHFPALPAPPAIDPVGAGDCAGASLIAALAAGTEPWEAAELANLAASVTVRKLGTTGTASPEEILEAARRAEKGR